MKIPFRTRLLLWWLRKSHRQMQSESGRLAFRNGGVGLKRVIIIFTENESDIRIARYFLKSILNNDEIDIVILGKGQLANADHNDGKVKVQKYCDGDFTFWGGVKTTSLNKLFPDPLDAIIDLNSEFNIQTAMITRFSKAALRVGFKSEHSHKFFNIEIDHKPETFVERGYISIQKLMGL